MKKIFILTFIVFTISSCRKEYNYLTEDEKKASLFYSYNEEKTFILKSNTNEILICSLQSKKIDSYKVNSRYSNIKQFGEIIELSFSINGQNGTFKSGHRYDYYDDYFLLYTEIDFPNIGYFEFVGSDEFYVDTLINGKTYHNVYSFKNNNQELYTNVEDGIIFIKNDTISYSKFD